MPVKIGKGDTYARRRRERAYATRVQAAKTERNQDFDIQHTNGDEQKYPNYIGSYSKCLDHNDLGEVDKASYESLVRAVESGDIPDFEKITTETRLRIAGPFGGRAFGLIAPDARALTIPPAPSFSSTELAAEMIELYWMALLRDIPFAAYEEEPLVAAAIEDLSRLDDNRFENLNPRNLFLPNYSGVLDGPRVSQLLLWNDDYDGIPVEQKRSTPISLTETNGLEFITSYEEWLAAQRGFPKGSSIDEAPIDPQPRYIRNAKDMGWCADQSSINRTYLNAGLLLLGLGRKALSAANPYKSTHFIGGLGTFDIAHLEVLLGQPAYARHFCYQKWLHRRMRPEAFSGRIHNHLEGHATYPIHESLLSSPALARIYERNALVNSRRGLDSGSGTYLLPTLWGEGCPTHPSYPQGHGTAAGIGVTILKAWFDEDFVLPEAITVMPNADGTQLSPYRYGQDGPPLTIGGELNKLAYNITWGRNMSGLHYFSDGAAANALGEAMVIRLLREDRGLVAEQFSGFSLTKFDGTKVTI